MREIKFRAWDKKEEVMIYPENFIKQNGIFKGESWEQVIPAWSMGETKDRIFMQYIGLKDNTKWEELTQEEQERWLRFRKTENRNLANFPLNLIRKWFNSKKAKNEWKGREIYEGDIVKFQSIFHPYEEIGVIKWKDNGFYIVGRRNDDVFLHPCNTEYILIIGNIYENPELLGGKNDTP